MTADWKLIQAWAGVPADGVPGDVTARAIIAKAGLQAEPIAYVRDLTQRIVLEILEHEAIVLEAYKDSVGVWTWGVGVTSKSGHGVDRYKDAPQTVQKCLEIYVWLLREQYLPAVLKAFQDFPLTECELGAALSFHYNTGAIGTADWVKLVKQGRRPEAREAFMAWSKPKEIIGRRKLERDLFFDGRWTSDGKVTVYPEVSKPSYAPKWSSAVQIDVREPLAKVMGR